MAEVTVSQFAEVLKVPVDRLITQLDEAGIKVKGADDIISDEAKMELLTHLRRSHGRQEDAAAPRKITLKRKAQQEIKVDDLLVVDSERKAREVALYRQGKFRDVRLAGAAKKAEDVFSQMGEQAGAVVSLIVKADVQGSAEALRDAFTKLSTEEVVVKVIASGVGGITESDVTLAAASKARIIGFNVRADGAARNAVKDTGVDVHYYSIIYEAIDDVKQAMTGLLKPEIKEQIVGLAEVREVFRSSKFGTVAGCLVVEGYIKRGNPVRVLRDNVVIHQGELDSLRRFKDDVGEVRAGTECGIGVRNYNDIRAGDQIECFSRVEVARSA